MQSFDVPLTDGRTITAESAGQRLWVLFLFSPSGYGLDRIGTKLGTLGEVMRYAEGLARNIERDRVTV